MVKRFHVILAGVLVLIAYLLRSYRHYALKIPNVGFIVHALLGGDVPPYITNEAFSKYDEWKSPHDVIAAIPAKSGTTWMLYTLHSIRTRGRAEEIDDILITTRWPDFIYYPGQPWEERKQILIDSRTDPVTGKPYPFPVYKTHKHPPYMKLSPETKYVVTIRSPYEMLASFKPFMQQHTKEFAEMWGGFPQGAGTEPNEQFEEEFFKMAFIDLGGGKSALDEFLCEFLDGFWPHRNDKNVFFIHYNDRIRDHRGSIARLAKFLDFPLTEAELDVVAEQTTFAAMKRLENGFNFEIFKDFHKRKLVPEKVKHVMRKGGFLAKGGDRKGKEELSAKYIAELDKYLQDRYTPEAIKWLTGEPGMNISTIQLRKNKP